MCKELFTKGDATRREIAAVVGKLIWWNPAIFNVKLLSMALQQMTGGIDDTQRWDEVVQFSKLVLCELQFWARNMIEMVTRQKSMIENFEIERTRLEAGGAPDCNGSAFPLCVTSSPTESQMARAPYCGYQA